MEWSDPFHKPKTPKSDYAHPPKELKDQNMSQVLGKVPFSVVARFAVWYESGQIDRTRQYAVAPPDYVKRKRELND